MSLVTPKENQHRANKILLKVLCHRHNILHKLTLRRRKEVYKVTVQWHVAKVRQKLAVNLNQSAIKGTQRIKNITKSIFQKVNA